MTKADQQRYDDIHAPRCVCCERPFSESLPKAGELTFMGQHGDGCKDYIDALRENE